VTAATRRSGQVVRWGQADRGTGFGFAHLFWRDAATGLDEGHRAVCGYDPTRHNGQARDVQFRPAADDAVRCERCLTREAALTDRVFYLLGQHPDDEVPA